MQSRTRTSTRSTDDTESTASAGADVRWRLAILATALVAIAGLLFAVDPGDDGRDRAVTVGRKATGTNPVTPGDFTGYGFDQCLTPTQAAMDTWLQHSPFLAVGIYISGDSRACRNQPNLTPQWVSTQLANGWRLLPIILGPQASCQPRFPRYADDFKISPTPGANGKYSQARTQGQTNANQSVIDAQALGIVPGSTLWYDLEGFNLGNKNCRESALAFVSAWVSTVKAQGYVAGVYSSAGSGIKALDDARVNRPTAFTFPDRIWIARWDGVANTSTSYIRADGWLPGNRMKQYRGGHDEVWGGVRINIDSNWLDFGAGSVAKPERHCGGVTISFTDYPALARPTATTRPAPKHVKALQCLLQSQAIYTGALDGVYDADVMAAVRQWQKKRGIAPDAAGRWFKRDWMMLLNYGYRPVLKVGSAGLYVRRVQRSLNAAAVGSTVRANGLYDAPTIALVKRYQSRLGLAPSGIVNSETWNKLAIGARPGNAQARAR
ncbi:glycoside hydrolase domain-containing protein [Nocardioides sp. R-C-SC26]|uniref:glycoside hydrolase domain-containing protein n=1 Tax=Nocardioides sp. R-C-SC26 TaxID=2870414 RepID=UPI001E411E54|nr:glycoside hydrolase domain-containing protein [Nocardioides sp. R-C-SC26]